MSIEENKAIARRFLQCWSAGGQAIVDELALPIILVSYTSWPEPLHGAENFKHMLTETFSFFPDMKIEADEVIAEGERVMVRWTYQATHMQGELFGVQPTGKAVRVSGVTVHRIIDGKVTEENGIVDNLSLMQQLGAIPSEG